MLLVAAVEAASQLPPDQVLATSTTVTQSATNQVATLLPFAGELVSHLATAAIGAGGVGGVWGLWTWLSERSKARAGAPAALTASLATFQAALNEQAQALIASLRVELAEVRARVDQLEAENVRCQGENRRALRRIAGLETLLSRSGVAVPESSYGAPER